MWISLWVRTSFFSRFLPLSATGFRGCENIPFFVQSFVVDAHLGDVAPVLHLLLVRHQPTDRSFNDAQQVRTNTATTKVNILHAAEEDDESAVKFFIEEKHANLSETSKNKRGCALWTFSSFFNFKEKYNVVASFARFIDSRGDEAR